MEAIADPFSPAVDTRNALRGVASDQIVRA